MSSAPWFGRFLGVVAFAAATVGAQVAPEQVVVASRQAWGPAAALYKVDLAAGSITPLGRFPSDHLPPLAVAIDDLDRGVLLALDLGGASRLVRLQVTAGAIVGERLLADVPGPVAQVLVEVGGDIVLAVDGPAGGIVRVPRAGGAARPVLAAPYATAVGDSGHVAGWFALGQSGADGSPPRDAQVGIVSLPTGTFSIGPTPLVGHRPRAITGIVDLPTGLVRHVLVHDDGSASMFELGIGVRPLAVTPTLPAGATVAMKDGSDAFEPMVLGGAAHPYLKSFNAFGGVPQWRTLAGPIPGDPVDFDWAPPASGHVELFGEACGVGMPLQATFLNGWPILGNARFALAVAQARANQPAVLALGDSDQSYRGVPLPLPLPGGCPLLVAPDFVYATLANAQGLAVAPLPVPVNPGLVGVLLFGEWVQVPGSAFVTSAGLALEIGL